MSPIGTTFQIAWGDHIQSKLPSLQDSFGASKHGFLSKLPSRWDSKCRDFTSSKASDTKPRSSHNAALPASALTAQLSHAPACLNRQNDRNDLSGSLEDKMTNIICY